MLRRLIIALAALLLYPPIVLAQHAHSEAAQARSFPVPPVLARAAVLMDATNGRVLFGLNPHIRLPMASTTKMMTALLALKFGRLQDRITVPRAAFDYESDATVMGLQPGQVVTLRDLLYGLLLPSGADAANTIAIHYGGTEKHFADLMNQEAAQLGLHDTHYVNAHGLPAANHYSSAYDLAVLGQYISYMPDLRRIVAARSYHWDGRVLKNVNQSLFWYPGVDGVKPGYTYAAGICQVLDARRDGRHVVVALLNTPNIATDARNLLNYGLSDYRWEPSPASGDTPSAAMHGVAANVPYLYFPATGHYVRGLFLKSFLTDGGAPALGFPRTEVLAEGASQVQYFQNAILTLDRGSHTVRRLSLMAAWADWSGAGTSLASGPRTSTPIPASPTPRPGVTSATPGTTSTATPRPSIYPAFVTWLRSHKISLGNPISTDASVYGYRVQAFMYGALLFDSRHKAVLMLPLGDRILMARKFLPAHPGDAYPSSFAGRDTLQRILWLQRPG